VASALEGHEAAYSELLRRYQRPVYQLLVHMVGDHHVAEDLTQETFLRVHTSLHTYRPELRFSPWIFRIANNLGVDHLRQRLPQTLSLEGSPHADTPRAVQATAFQIAAPTPAPTSTPRPRPDPRQQAAAVRQAIGRFRSAWTCATVLRGRPRLSASWRTLRPSAWSRSRSTNWRMDNLRAGIDGTPG
jgi:RNA polymerase sigma-70 factor (ECF subfamily)